MTFKKAAKKAAFLILQQLVKPQGHRGLYRYRLTVQRVDKAQRLRMKRKAGTGRLFPSVQEVAVNGKAQVRHVYANLVRPPGLQPEFKQHMSFPPP